jgi:hypothetical protein
MYSRVFPVERRFSALASALSVISEAMVNFAGTIPALTSFSFEI